MFLALRSKHPLPGQHVEKNPTDVKSGCLSLETNSVRLSVWIELKR